LPTGAVIVSVQVRLDPEVVQFDDPDATLKICAGPGEADPLATSTAIDSADGETLDFRLAALVPVCGIVIVSLPVVVEAPVPPVPAEPVGGREAPPPPPHATMNKTNPNGNSHRAKRFTGTPNKKRLPG
jgi:hypothetical protein